MFLSQFVVELIKSVSIKKVYPGLSFDGPQDEPLPFDAIPGLNEAGWTEQEYLKSMYDDRYLYKVPSEEEKTFTECCLEIITFLKNDKNSWPFLKPVDEAEAADYYKVIKSPIGRRA